MGYRWLAIVFSITAIFLFSAVAAAQPKGGGARPGPSVMPPGSTPVLTFDSDDAEEQADAFTSALRAKVKSTPGWVLSENTFSLGILTAALKCRIDAPCLQKVGDQLKTDKFFWGKVNRLGKNQVVVEAHYWQRAKHDSVVKETYSDDLRDPNNEALKKIATRVFERLTNTLTTGMVAVQAGKGTGTVVVDGSPAGTLASGLAQIELKAGAHTVEVHVPGYLPVRQSVNVQIGAETPLTLTLVPEPSSNPPPSGGPGPEQPGPSGSTRVLAYSLVGGGVVAGVVGAVMGVQWFSKKSEQEDARKQVSAEIPNVCEVPANATAEQRTHAEDACKADKDAHTLSLVGWIAGGVGVALVGTGLVLMMTKNGGGDARPASAAVAPQRPKLSVTPLVGPREGMIRVGLAF